MARAAEEGAAAVVAENERSLAYVAVMTDEDLAADPPGHRSGVVVFRRPNAVGLPRLGAACRRCF
jgi:hypothetical protein